MLASPMRCRTARPARPMPDALLDKYRPTAAGPAAQGVPHGHDQPLLRQAWLDLVPVTTVGKAQQGTELAGARTDAPGCPGLHEEALRNASRLSARFNAPYLTPPAACLPPWLRAEIGRATQATADITGLLP